MQSTQPSLFTRGDTLFGVCEALGEDFGFNPLYLRAALGVSLIWNPVAVLGAYGAAAVVVLVSRVIYPGVRRGVVVEQGDVAADVGVEPVGGRKVLEPQNDEGVRELVAA